MATMRQYYDEGGARFDLGGEPGDVLAPWIAHRARLRAWLGGLSDEDLAGPTRCEAWSGLDIIRHLLSVTHFFRYTVSRARKGEATQVLKGFDTQVTPNTALKALDGLGPDALRSALEELDGAFATELEELDDAAWLARAEGPPGWMPVRATLNHALFDSWIHERDLMIPRGLEPLVEHDEALVVGRYLLSLAGAAAAGFADGVVASASGITVEATDPSMRFGIDASGERVRVGDAAVDGPVVRGTIGDVLDLTSGRTPRAPVAADADGLAFLERMAAILA